MVVKSHFYYGNLPICYGHDLVARSLFVTSLEEIHSRAKKYDEQYFESNFFRKNEKSAGLFFWSMKDFVRFP